MRGVSDCGAGVEQGKSDRFGKGDFGVLLGSWQVRISAGLLGGMHLFMVVVNLSVAFQTV